jgi:hypothetical protein
VISGELVTTIKLTAVGTELIAFSKTKMKLIHPSEERVTYGCLNVEDLYLLGLRIMVGDFSSASIVGTAVEQSSEQLTGYVRFHSN